MMGRSENYTGRNVGDHRHGRWEIVLQHFVARLRRAT
jgi:hypothetical protein